MALLEQWAEREFSVAAPDEMSDEQRGALEERLRAHMRENTYDPQTATITLGADRAAAIAEVSAYYESLFGNDPQTAELREAYAMKNDTVLDPDHLRGR